PPAPAKSDSSRKPVRCAAIRRRRQQETDCTRRDRPPPRPGQYRRLAARPFRAPHSQDSWPDQKNTEGRGEPSASRQGPSTRLSQRPPRIPRRVRPNGLDCRCPYAHVRLRKSVEGTFPSPESESNNHSPRGRPAPNVPPLLPLLHETRQVSRRGAHR